MTAVSQLTAPFPFPTKKNEGKTVQICLKNSRDVYNWWFYVFAISSFRSQAA